MGVTIGPLSGEIQIKSRTTRPVLELLETLIVAGGGVGFYIILFSRLEL